MFSNNIDLLVKNLLQTAEAECLELKQNNSDPKTIGENISALANSAACKQKEFAYIIWGIEDTTHNIIGTTFDYENKKIGSEELQNWLRKLLSSNANFEFHKTNIQDKKIAVLVVYKALNSPVTFEGNAYIRVGSYTKKIKDHPNLEANLWQKINETNFEEFLIRQNVSSTDILKLLDYPTYFDMTKTTLPTERAQILHYLLQDKLIAAQDNGLFAITNLGAILFAKQSDMFTNTDRKSVRVIQYEKNDRINTLREEVGKKGYACGFENLIKFIDNLLPQNETIKDGIRQKISVYPEIAVRELVANALIHQDFSIAGTGPMVEIFTNRIEITNPGTPLIDIRRIIDNPPRSRNERLATLTRRLGICEERGSGWDKVAAFCELYQLPSPKIETFDNATRVTLYSHIPFSNMGTEDKLRTCYLHACLQQAKNEQMTNASLRTRFGLSETSSASISRLIKSAIEKGFIKPLDASTAPKHMKYLPFWV